MTVPSVLVDNRGTLLHTEKIGAHTHLVVEDHARVATQFKSESHTTSATTAIATPRKGLAVVITDITITGEKINGGTITLQWADGTDTAVITKAHVTDGPVNMHAAYAGRKYGWKDARIDFITDTANQDANVDVGYYFIAGDAVLSFTDWDTLRT